MLKYLKIILLLLVAIVVSKRFNEDDRDISFVEDVPLKSDLHGLLASLRRTVKYCFRRKTDIDVSLAFGLFLIHVNLKSCLESNKVLPDVLRNELHDILEENDKLMEYIKQREPDNDPEEGNIHLTPLLKVLSWVDQLERFKPVRKRAPLFRLGSHDGRSDPDWKDYLKRMPAFELWTPSPETSDYCISSLIDSPKTPEQTCKVSKICHHMLRNGTNFGYALTHRLLFLVQARSGRGCSIYSPTVDKSMRHEFCGRAYEEAEYIAVHDYDYMDLLLEQIALCSLDGHSEFLHHSWLTRILQHQAPLGCFGEYPQRMYTGREGRRSFKIEHDFAEDMCNKHITGVAAASLAAAVRFIVQMYYE